MRLHSLCLRTGLGYNWGMRGADNSLLHLRGRLSGLLENTPALSCALFPFPSRFLPVPLPALRPAGHYSIFVRFPGSPPPHSPPPWFPEPLTPPLWVLWDPGTSAQVPQEPVETTLPPPWPSSPWFPGAPDTPLPSGTPALQGSGSREPLAPHCCPPLPQALRASGALQAPGSSLAPNPRSFFWMLDSQSPVPCPAPH